MPNPRVFTILNCGTDYDEPKRDVIAVLASDKLGGKRETEWIINAGPGTAGAAKEAMAMDPSAKVAMVTAARVKQSLEFPRVAFGRSIPTVDVESAGENLGEVFGLGMEATTRKTIKLLKKIGLTNGVINMAAWSRGAITSIEIANLLQRDKYFYDCHVNLFLFDPVPGPKRLNCLNWTELRKVVPDNVRQCSVIFMEDETRWLQGLLTSLVQPFTHNKEGGTHFHLYPLPGLHSSAVEWNPNDQSKWYPSFLIGRHLCYKFLYEHGTPLKNREKDPWLIHHPNTLCNLYAILKLVILEVWRGISMRRLGEIPNALRNDPYFINEHNRHMFWRTFPKTYHQLSCLHGGIPQRMVLVPNEERQMLATAPQVQKLLHWYDHLSPRA